MGTGIGPEGWRTTQGLLQELHSRAKRAQSLLGNLVDKHKKFFDVSTEAIIDVFDLSADKANTLREFAQKMMDLIDRAYLQAETKLQKLLNALENTNITIEVESGKKTIHIFPSSEEWYISAHYQKKTWIYSLPIRRLSTEVEFPDILNLSDEDIKYLQRGWRASDESQDKEGRASMTTTQKWQIFAWASTRPGRLWIYIDSLNLNKKFPTMQFLIVSSWQQQWPGRDGKKQAKQELEQEQHPLTLLTWYLGDGTKGKAPEFLDGEIPKRRPMTREEAKIMLEFAYKTGIGKLMDVLECDKWKLLKSFVNQKQQFPIHATFNGYTFWLNYNNSRQNLQARTQLKDPSEAEKLLGLLGEMGIQGRIYTVKTRYYIVEITGQNLLKLAENYKEWRRAIKQLAEKYKLQPRGPVTRRLLELAENPPPVS
jgi:hypothetical protein